MLGLLPGRPQGGRHGMVFAFRAVQSSPIIAHSSLSTIAPAFIIGDYYEYIDVSFQLFGGKIFTFKNGEKNHLIFFMKTL